MKTISLIWLTVCVVAAANVQFELEPRIVGGQSAANGQFPYQVSLRSRILRFHFCGASILNSRFLLTAAHCTIGLHSHPFTFVAVVGTVKRHFDGVAHKIKNIFRHSGFNAAENIHDIALLKTVNEISFNTNIWPIGLPIRRDHGNTTVILTGWGDTQKSGSTARVLQYIETKTIRNKLCSRLVRNVHNTTICTLGKSGMGACFGDSGGPLVDPNRKTLVGIMTWIIPCAKGHPDGFTRVYSYVDWIKNTMWENQLPI